MYVLALLHTLIVIIKLLIVQNLTIYSFHFYCELLPTYVLFDHSALLQVRVPISLCLIIVLAYICSGAVLFHRLENWSLLEGSYFCFTSLGTIGFGDLLPGKNAEEVSLCACSAYILTGMALVAMCFSLVQEEVMGLLRFIGAACSRAKSAKNGDEEQRAVGGS